MVLTKPPYLVPSMSDVRDAAGSSGFNVVSTFSGCGGSCLGFEMAGFEILWASEFVPAASATYRLNHPGVFLDERDVRDVRPEDILERIGRSDVDVLEGSPPCASFSTAGTKEAGWGKIRKYSDTKQRVDDLFFEFVRILRGIRPRVFVAENVSGLVKGKAKGYFKEILSAMEESGYLVRAKLLDAQWLGVPQERQRVIFIGVRDDLVLSPVFPSPLKYRYSVDEAIASLRGPQTGASLEGQAIGREYDKLRPGGASKKYFSLVRADGSRPCPTVTAAGAMNSGIACVTHPTEKRKFSIPELKRICGFPDDFVLTGSYAQQWERLGRAVPPPMMRSIAIAVRDEILAKAAA